MRLRLLFALIALGATLLLEPPAQASAEERETPPASRCLAAREMRDVVAARKVIPPADAARAARAAEPGEVVRIRLCRNQNDVLVYEITNVKRDGRVQRVTIDATSGKVSAIR